MRGYRITERQDVRDHFTWRSLGAILPFLWEYRGRALLALVFLVLAKVSLIGVPLLLKEIIELFESGDTALVALPPMVPRAAPRIPISGSPSLPKIKT